MDEQYAPWDELGVTEAKFWWDRYEEISKENETLWRERVKMERMLALECGESDQDGVYECRADNLCRGCELRNLVPNPLRATSPQYPS